MADGAVGSTPFSAQIKLRPGRAIPGHPNPLLEWLKEHRPGVASVIKKFDVSALGVYILGSTRMVLVVLVGEPARPLSVHEAFKLGMTQEDFESFDRSVDYDDLVLVLDWQACKWPLEECEVEEGCCEGRGKGQSVTGVFELTEAGRVRKELFSGDPRRHASVLVRAEKMNNAFEIETGRGILRGRAGDFLVMDTTGENYYVFPQEMEPLFGPLEPAAS